jgi:hypothetical protein
LLRQAINDRLLADHFLNEGQKGSNAKSKDRHCVPLRGKACGWVEWLVLGGS